MRYTVYTIRHIGTDIVLYVGKTKNFKRRVYQHLTLNSTTKEWLAAIGIDNVLIEPVAEFNNEVDALKYEDELILKYDTINRGYNKYRSGLIEAENPKEYRKTEKYREWKRGYQQTEKYREWQREYEKEYQQTEKYREWKRGYRQTEKYREYHRDYIRDYRAAKKLGMSVAEYREKNF